MFAIAPHRVVDQRNGERFGLVLSDEADRQSVIARHRFGREVNQILQLIEQQRPGSVAIVLAGGETRRLRHLLDAQLEAAAFAIGRDHGAEIDGDGARCHGRIRRRRAPAFRQALPPFLELWRSRVAPGFIQSPTERQSARAPQGFTMALALVRPRYWNRANLRKTLRFRADFWPAPLELAPQ